LFKGFSESAKLVVARAQDCARDLKHGYVGTEHLLIALLADESEIPAQVLSSFRIDQEKVRARLLATVGIGSELQNGTLPFTPSAKNALEMGMRESLALGQRHIRSGHLLLGVLRDYDGPAVRLLLDLDVPLVKVRELVLERLLAPSPEERSSRSGEPPAATPRTAPGSSSTIGSFAALPDARLRELLRIAAARAAEAGRREFELGDLLAAANELPKAL
jgi:ATP-dependent Clp protease ATP-binding subunit ClpC